MGATRARRKEANSVDLVQKMLALITHMNVLPLNAQLNFKVHPVLIFGGYLKVMISVDVDTIQYFKADFRLRF